MMSASPALPLAVTVVEDEPMASLYGAVAPKRSNVVKL